MPRSAFAALAGNLRGDKDEFLAQLGAPASVTDCSSSGAPLKFTKLTVNPNPPTFGTPLVLDATGDITSAVTDGTYSIAVKLDGFQIFTHSGPICGTSTFNLPLGSGSAKITGLSCPTASGDSETVSGSLTLPTGTPSGTYNVQLSGADTSGSEVFCVDLQWDS